MHGCNRLCSIADLLVKVTFLDIRQMCHSAVL